jgi:hypothetical protein
MGIDPFMHVRQERLALLPGDVVELNSSFMEALELAVDQHIHLGLAGDPLCLYIIVGEGLVLDVLQQLLCPQGSYTFS